MEMSSNLIFKVNNMLYCLIIFINFIHMYLLILYRNRTAEHLYGYSPAEALGQDAIELLTDPRDSGVAGNIVHRVMMGESWTGQFPVKNKRGDQFVVVATNTPFYDDDGTLVGIICVTSDSKPFQEAANSLISVPKELENTSSSSKGRRIASSTLGLDPEQPLQAAIASKISNLVGILLYSGA